MVSFVSKSYRWQSVTRVGFISTLLGCSLLLGFASADSRQVEDPERIWNRSTHVVSGNSGTVRHTNRDRREVFRLNRRSIRELLARAPKEQSRAQLRDGLEIQLPMPDGQTQRFAIVESSVMDPALAARYPGIKTYRGVGLDDPTERLRMDLTPAGLHGQVLRRGRDAYIDPMNADGSDYVVYFREEALRTDDEFECLAEATSSMVSAASASASAQSDGLVRTFRLALATTAEYTQFHGGTVEGSLAAIATAVNRLNGIYEAELGIRFVLVANNDQLLYTDPAIDPYSNDDGSAMLSQNQATLDSVIGSANYDIGHVFATGGGGLAQVGSVCASGLKGRGVTGRANPAGDPFYIDYFAHEMGHQFGARHTFNGVIGSCGGNNRYAGTAFEPGSGSTIMSYAGICSDDNLQSSSDAYFHSASLVEIQNFVNGGCAATEPSGNNAPLVNAGAGYTIPVGTPFELAATGSDPDGDSITYCWEQLDLGPATTLAGVDSGNGPLFRSFSPVTDAARSFPQLSDVLNNVQSTAEVLPVTDRFMTFRVTARDDYSGAGAFAMDEVVVRTTTASGPFGVVFPNSDEVLSGVQTVVWDVANSDQPPVSAQQVDILLSTNGGANFSILLAEQTPNDGFEELVLPELYAENARIKIQASDNIFFDISDADFLIIPVAEPVPAIVFETNTIASLNEILIPATGTQGTSDPFPMELVVSDLAGVIDAVTVTLHGLTHSWLDDLDILLVSPGGQSVMLMSDAASGWDASNVDLTFSDAGAALPTDTPMVTGVYRPLNIGASGDTFPVSAPYGSALDVFNELSPEGVWSLYVRDDATGDAGLLAGGWSLEVRTRQLVIPTNQPPVLASQPSLLVHAGAQVMVANEAFDSENLPSQLTYSLQPGAADGTTLDTTSGVLSWRPSLDDIGLTNRCVVTVTDAGSPALSDEIQFDLIVVEAPFIQGLEITNGMPHLRWSSIPGTTYNVQSTDNLTSGTWTNMATLSAVEGYEVQFVDPSALVPQRFYRIMVEE